MSGAMRTICKQAKRQGWKVGLTRSGHVRFVPPDRSVPALVTGSTPGDRRAVLNLRADLRRRGLVISSVS